MIYHIYPTNDIGYHETEGIICPCIPEVKTAPDGYNLLIVHNSYDGREALESDSKVVKH